MDVSMIMQAIGTLGFPIVAAAAMFWMVNNQNKLHKEEMDIIKDVLQANTIALVELKDALEDRKDEARN